MTLDHDRRRLAGAGGVPDIATVLRLRGHLHLESDTTIGGSVSDLGADTRLDRDVATGRPRWAGTGQAGVLRHHLAAVLGQDYAERVFGTGSEASPVHTTDALAYRADGGYPLVEVRDGNRVGTESGIVDRGAVFTEEVLTAGTAFPVDWSIHARPEHLLEITAGFVRALDGFGDGSIGLGSRSGKGRGAALLTGWSVDRHDLTTAEGFRSWFTRNRAPAWSPPTDRQADLIGSLETLLPGVAEQIDRLRAIDQRSRLVIRMTVAIAETIREKNTVTRPATMVQSAGRGDLPEPAATTTPETATGGGDRTRDTRALARTPLSRPLGADGNLTPIDSGSAVHAMLKRHTGWILHEIANHADDQDLAHDRADRLLDDLFGTVIRTGRPSGTLRPSRVRVTEAAITGAAVLRLPHVRLNPLTQGVVDHHLFFEDVLVGGHSDITVTVTRPHLHDLGVLACVLRDLHFGAAPPMGAATTNGHGRRLLTDAALVVPAGIRESDTAPRHYESWTAFTTGKDTDLPKAAVSALVQAVQEGSR